MKKSRILIGLILVLVVGIVACTAPTPHKLNSEIKRIEDSLKNGNNEAAKQIIAKRMSESKDSDMYYRWLSVQNRVWYAEMNADSMTAVSNRIHNYLIRHQYQLNDTRRLIWAEWYKTSGVFQSAIMGRPDSAVVYNEKAINMLQTLKEENELRLTAMTNQAYYYWMWGKYDKSVEGYIKAMELADSIGKSEADKVPLLLGISTVYTFMGDYERSNYWWSQCEKLLSGMIKSDQFIYYNDRGNDYYFQEKYKEALFCYKKAAKLTEVDDKKAWDYYTSLTNMGEVYVCLGEADSAKIFLATVDSFFRKVDYTPLLYYIETSKIKLEMLKGNTSKALQMLEHSKIADPQIPSARVQRFKATEQIMRQTGNYREAYEAYHHMDALNDSLQKQKTSMRFSTKLLEYEHDKRLIEQQRVIERARTDKLLAWGFFTVMLLTAIILFVLIMLVKRHQRYNELRTRQQIVLMRMENIRNRITPHFIYNALNHEVLAQMEGRKVDLNSLTQLLRRGVEQAGVFQTSLAEELRFVNYYVDIEGKQMGPDFNYSQEIANDVNTQNVYLPSMTIQIFAENAIKHGLRPIKPTEGKQRWLQIKTTRQNQATLVEVIDNGVGLQETNNHGTLIGGKVVKQTIQLLNDNNVNKISFGTNNWEKDGESGCRSWILLPDDYNYKLTKQDK